MRSAMNKEETLYTRTEMLLGEDAVEKLKAAKVIVFGVGGVGGFAVEALARAGVGHIALVDSDKVSVSNLNRQIIATVSNIGSYKTEAMMNRIRDINRECDVCTYNVFYSEETADGFVLEDYDYVVDCIDSVRSKLHLIEKAKKSGTNIISSMGAGNKLDPTRFKVSDISKTNTDPLAKVIRTELRKKGINHLKVVFSDEAPIMREGERVPGSISFVPSVVGLIIGGEVIKDLIK